MQGRRFELRKAYCSGNDRDVPVLLIGDLAGVETPSPRDAQQLVCLDYGVRCTGYMCPLFSVPTGGEPARPAPARTPSAERGRTS